MYFGTRAGRLLWMMNLIWDIVLVLLIDTGFLHTELYAGFFFFHFIVLPR